MPLTNQDFEASTNLLQLTADSILQAKGPDYASHAGDNRLANFELVAQLLQGAPTDAMTTAAVYWLKHVLAICTYVRTRKPGSEPILGRFADERNYNALLWACLQAVSADQDTNKDWTEIAAEDYEQVLAEQLRKNPNVPCCEQPSVGE